ncbi:MAG: aminotransferase class V-fold PLP-dependent enzyme [Candidatus Hodarchaeales archaeon]|jgi:selenocysteine lyase/cysteine desulfurase
MKDNYSEDFNLSTDNIWLNCAHQGPLPKNAVESIHQAISWKINPHTFSDHLFFEVPIQLKKTIGELINAQVKEIILGNSTSYGLYLLVNGMKWSKGDEILLVEGDFPANIVPWFPLEKIGVKIRYVKSEKNRLTPDSIEKQINTNTKLFCTTWVNSFTGYAVDHEEIGKICHENDIKFILNGSQAIGYKPLDVSSTYIDGLVSCGSKWLCGPYGTGFAWFKEELIQQLDYNQVYWLTLQKNKLNKMRNFVFTEEKSATRLDVFGTANFLNYLPWLASIQYLLEQGINNIEKYNQQMVTAIVANLDYKKYKIISPVEESAFRSCLVIISCKNPENAFRMLKEKNIHISLRENNLRISPHLYNKTEQVYKVVEELNC